MKISDSRSTPSSTLFIKRVAAQLEHARQRAERLRSAVPKLARALYLRGARRVILFGSLAGELYAPHADTDIDLCCEGLTEDRATAALWELEQLVDAKIDLVCWETASPRVRGWILRNGLEVRNGSE